MVEATSLYHSQLAGSPAEEYLENRGLLPKSKLAQAQRFRLGYVQDPLPGHEHYAGMLCIPYLRRDQASGWSVVSLRFRCIQDHDHKGHGKYLTMPGDRPRLFNTLALLEPSNVVGISEGELDAVTASLVGVPTVGVSGAQAWQDHFREPFLGYRSVYVFADGDEPGMKFAGSVARKLPNAEVIQMPPGEDLNSVYVAQGPRAITERIR